MISIGLTGGIGSGKSSVARLLATHGAIVIDSDTLAREALAPGSDGLARVVARFGPGVLTGDGSLDRAGLGRTVFADPEALAALNAIVHPYVRRRSAELMAAAATDAVVVHDVPLLVENGLQDGFDLVVVVDAPPETQLARLIGMRGMSEDDALARMAAQAPRETRLAAADHVLDNSGLPTELEAAVSQLWDRLTGR